MLNAQFFTDTGQHREKNEDAGGIFYNQTQQQMLVLCDGMGGHQAGEIASQFVTYELQKRFEEENLIEINRAESWLRSNIKEINFQLYNYAQENEDYRGMGTTLVCAIIYDKQVVVANVGDSRAYVINQRQMDQITSDHSFVKRTHFYDYLLLNSDGLTDYVRDYEIQELLSSNNSLDVHGNELLDLALAHDSKDNVSFILLKLEGDKV
ncbi:MAG: protein phosphatase [Staphylococcus epidermidis]|nr:MAG: protein phosphatase [Staphylococcus epidermidis]